MSDKNKTLNLSRQLEKTLDSQSRSLFLDDSSLNFRDSMRVQEEESIKVYIRVNPVTAAETKLGSLLSKDNDIRISQNRQIHILNGKETSKSFQFDYIFTHETNDQMFLTTIPPVLKNSLKGYNSAIFAYGSGGTGKETNSENE